MSNSIDKELSRHKYVSNEKEISIVAEAPEFH